MPPKDSAGLDAAAGVAAGARADRTALGSQGQPAAPVLTPGATGVFRPAARAARAVAPRPAAAMVAIGASAAGVGAGRSAALAASAALSSLEEQTARLKAVEALEADREAEADRQHDLERQSLLESAMDAVRDERRPSSLLG